MITMFLYGFMSITTFAGTANGDDDLSTATTTKADFVVKDDDGNKYRVYGNCTISGKSATVTTSFKIKLYKNGTDDADDLSKKLTVRGAMTFSNSAQNIGDVKYKTVTGSSGYYSYTYDGFVYNVDSVSGTHKFSCNGGSGSGASYTD